VKPTTASDTENPLLYQVEHELVAPGIHTIGGAGRSLVVETPDGLLLVDTGAGRGMVTRMQEVIRGISDAPVRWIVYSHGHLGYNFGTRFWLEEAHRLGHPRPLIVAHENVVRRYRRYEETTGLQNHINALQFRGTVPAPKGRLPLTYPDVTYTGSLTIHAGPGRTIRLIAAPSETDDVTAVWLPEDQVLYGSAGVIEAIPNVGTPLKTRRDPVRWADTLDRLAALGARAMVPEFGPVVRDRETIACWLGETAAVLRWLRRATVERMNRGLTITEILHDIHYPDDMFNRPWLRETYGHRDYIVRDIYRAENGWWEDRNPTTLHPAHPTTTATEIATAITDKQAVLNHATHLRDTGQTQQALHVIDLLALAPGDQPELEHARQLKRELCATLAQHNPSYISQSIYLAAAAQ
jgi:glyoxylase-like metal-dependent hydrolase (beta-lactamase superfamily II)